MRNYRYSKLRYQQQRRFSDMAGMSRSQRILAQLIFLAFIVVCIVVFFVFIVR